MDQAGGDRGRSLLGRRTVREYRPCHFPYRSLAPVPGGRPDFSRLGLQLLLGGGDYGNNSLASGAETIIRAQASLISYFALWSIFGPIGQLLFSSAGPIFYQRIGLGDRFAELSGNIPEVTQKVSGYLWDFHTTGTLGVGAGISAMPSLHIATVAWIYLAFRGQRSRLAPFTALFGLYVFALSVALGWHYAVDGIVGAAGAMASHWASAAYLRRRKAASALSAQAAAAQ